jgi:hypothetical protein
VYDIGWEVLPSPYFSFQITKCTYYPYCIDSPPVEVCLILYKVKKSCTPKYINAKKNLSCSESGSKNMKYKFDAVTSKFAPIQYV